ncbi:MAG: hypothetical protein IKB36_03660 [Clostridia bacterium]|nr:hypothetical protein [Clostridia bacterium]
MKNKEILKLANLSDKNYNKIIKQLEEEYESLQDNDIIHYIILETPFLKNWLTQNINNFLPDCMKISHYYRDSIYIADSYDYPSDYTECDIEDSIDEGKSIINFSIAREISGILQNAYPDSNYRYVLELVADFVNMYYTIYHPM